MSGRARLDTGCQRPNASSIGASRSIKLAVIACTSFRAAALMSSLQRCASVRGGAGLVASNWLQGPTHRSALSLALRRPERGIYNQTHV
jgi:hypothetical protein